MSLLDKASLVMTPNAVKESKVYSIIPSNGNGDLTFTRGTLAISTLTNNAGLIEIVPYNLIKFSEQFDNVAWGVLSGASVTANTTTAPNGTSTADTLNFLASASSAIFQSISSPQGNVTLSVYAKVASGTKQFRLRIDAAGGNSSTNFTATTEWQRFEFNVTTSVAGTNFYVINDSTGTAGNLYIWGAQLVQGSLPKDYFFTTDRLNVPRLNYDSVGGCPSLLLEPLRTNLVIGSNTISTFSQSAGISVVDNNIIGVDGQLSAALATTTLPVHFLYKEVNCLASTTYTVSFYVKRGTMTDMKYRFRDGTNNVDILGATSYYSQTSASGYSRVKYTLTTSIGCLLLRVYLLSDSGVTGTVYFTDVQVEAGAYPTSYIPTTTAIVTRNADTFTRNSIFTNGLITSAGGTWFVEFPFNDSLIGSTQAQQLGLGTATIVGGTADNIWIATTIGGSRLFIYKQIGGVITGLIQTSVPTNLKLAIKWNGVSMDVFQNGVKIVNGSAFTPTISLDNLRASTVQTTYYIKSMYLFPTPLTDAECIALTI
jgi:hypothetical protein